MAKHKVDTYRSKKLEHQHKAEVMAKRNKIAVIVGGILMLVLVVWIGYAVWDAQVHSTNTGKSAAQTEVNFDALDSYISGLHSK